MIDEYRPTQLSSDEKDTIYNALLVGMDIHDAYVLAGVHPSVISTIEDDEMWQMWIAKSRKVHEYSLLRSLDDVIEKQQMVGKEGAVTWALEHMYSRYSGKPQGDGKSITINFGKDDPKDIDTVEIHND